MQDGEHRWGTCAAQWTAAGKLTAVFFGEKFMLKLVGLIGYGVVGKASFHPFRHNAEAFIIDPAHSTNTIDDLVDVQPPLVFVSVNAPTLDDSSIDASVIYSIFEQLADIEYNGLVVLRSTLTPNIVDDLAVKYGYILRYIYSPEFIREAHWEKDADESSMMILAGTKNDCNELITRYRNHSCIPSWTKFRITDYLSASLAKYTINSFLATKVVFMNQLHRLFEDMNTLPITEKDWDEFTSLISSDPRVGASHLDVPGHDGSYGYGGSCFPKDMRAFIGYDKNGRLSIIREAELANTQIRLTGGLDSQ